MRIQVKDKTKNGEVKVKTNYWQRKVEKQLEQINNEIAIINNQLKEALR